MDPGAHRSRRRIAERPALAALLAASLVLLVAHAWSYRFLTDDAFISFSYARNLAEGHGLVFNPGRERVEGYTNFLWVLALAALDRAGLAPERAANALSMMCGVLVWLLVARAALRAGAGRAGGEVPAPPRPAWVLLTPPLLLAATRSFAVWCTSGLETKAFELFVVAGALVAEEEVAAARRGEPERWTRSALLLALACLARPDGAVIAAGLLGARWALERPRGAARLPAVARGAGLLLAVLLAHLAFRLAYYGDWVPNTYHAKVGGRTWWEMGARYLLAFAIEYGVLLWLPFLAAAGAAAIRGGPERTRLVLFAGALAPHATYLAAIGGDHFEYRPLDVAFPLVYLLLADGAAALAARGRAVRSAALALLLLLGANVLFVPWAGRLDFPPDYRAGFPGNRGRADGSQDLVSHRRFEALFRIPLVGSALEFYNAQIAEMTAHAVCNRQEEHALFIETVVAEGKALARLVEEGALPRDAHIAIGAVGAIPYFSGLRTLDRLGLTDRIVAKGPTRPPGARLMAHDKVASFDDALSRGVDLWALDNTHLLFGPEEPGIRDFAVHARDLGAALVAAPAVGDSFLLAAVPGGPERAARRLPRLGDAAEFFRTLADAPGEPWWAASNLGDVLAARGEAAGAGTAYEEAIRRAPDAARPEHHLGVLFDETGDTARAIAHLRRAVALDPALAKARFDLGRALADQGELREALVLIRDGAAAAPADVAMSSVLARFLASCPDRSLRDGAEAVRIAERLRRLTRARDARVLDTLGTAYASVGRFEEARRAVEDAIAIALSRGDEAMATEMRARATAYAAGRAWF